MGTVAERGRARGRRRDRPASRSCASMRAIWREGGAGSRRDRRDRGECRARQLERAGRPHPAPLRRQCGDQGAARCRRDRSRACRRRLAFRERERRGTRAVRDYAVIRAPFAGVVTQRLVDPGAFAAPGVPLVDRAGWRRAPRHAPTPRLTWPAHPTRSVRIDAIDRGPPVRRDGGRRRSRPRRAIVYTINALVANPRALTLRGQHSHAAPAAWHAPRALVPEQRASPRGRPHGRARALRGRRPTCAG